MVVIAANELYFYKELKLSKLQESWILFKKELPSLGTYDVK